MVEAEELRLAEQKKIRAEQQKRAAAAPAS